MTCPLCESHDLTIDDVLAILPAYALEAATRKPMSAEIAAEFSIRLDAIARTLAEAK